MLIAFPRGSPCGREGSIDVIGHFRVRYFLIAGALGNAQTATKDARVAHGHPPVIDGIGRASACARTWTQPATLVGELTGDGIAAGAVGTNFISVRSTCRYTGDNELESPEDPHLF